MTIPSYVLEHMRSSSTLTQAVSLPLQPASEALHTPIASAAVQQSLSLLKMATTVLVLPMQPYEQSPAVVQLGENGMTIAVNSNLLGSFLQCASSGSSRHPKPLNNQFTALMQPCDTGFSTAVNPNTFGALLTGSTSLSEVCKPDWDTDPAAFSRFPKPEPSNARWPGGWLRKLTGYQEPIPSRL